MSKLIASHLPSVLLLLVAFTTAEALYARDEIAYQSQPVDVVSENQKLLAVETEAIAREKAEIAQWRSELASRSKELASRSLEQSHVEQARTSVETRKIDLEATLLDIATAEQIRDDLINALEKLNDRLQLLASDSDTVNKDKLSGTKAEIAEKRLLLDIELKHIQNLIQRGKMTKEHLLLAEQWQNILSNAYQQQQEEADQSKLEAIQKKLVEEKRHWLNIITEHNLNFRQFSEDPFETQADHDLDKVKLSEAKESLFLIGVREKLAYLRSYWEKLSSESTDSRTYKYRLRATRHQLGEFLTQLGQIDSLLKSKLEVLERRLEIIQSRQGLDAKSQDAYKKASTIISELIEKFELQSHDISALHLRIKERGNTIDSVYVEQKKADMMLRHQLPNSIEDWTPLLIELQGLPAKLFRTGNNILISLKAAMEQAGVNTWLLLLTLALIWSTLCLSLRHLPLPVQFKDTGSFTKKTIHIAISLIRENRLTFLVSGLLIISGWVMDIIPPGLALISILSAIWIVSRVMIGLSWWILKSPLGLQEKQPKLHNLIVLMVIVTSIFGLGLAMAHLGFLSSSLTELVDRLFFLLLLPPAYLALKVRTLMIEFLEEHKKNTYWSKLIGLAGLLIPLAFLATALLGITGYIYLAWTVAGYLSKFIIVVSLWLVARGLVIDLARSTETALGKRSHRSTFWIRSFVDPLHKLTRLMLFILSVWVLYRLFVDDPTSGLNLKHWLKTPLFSIGETAIDSLQILGTLVLLGLVFYIGKWAREITYGWIYGRVQDLGIRNSLSVFTQYVVVVIGLLVALNILGINLTSLAVFAGALGVGIGFGLQNIANNFISGLILLAERPVRTKDWVTIGTNEGEVSQIGMRSVTVTTWDNQDVIIPNSELVSNAFINWTRTDNVVRTLLVIGIRYQNDPHDAQQVILDAIIMQPEVAMEPAPRVLLSNFGPSSVDFRIQYHTDVRSLSLYEVKSKVMFAIWDALKEADIGIPFPQQDIYIKELPDVRDGSTESLFDTAVEKS